MPTRDMSRIMYCKYYSFHVDSLSSTYYEIKRIGPRTAKCLITTLLAPPVPKCLNSRGVRGGECILHLEISTDYVLYEISNVAIL